MKKKITFLIIIVLVLAAAAGVWFFIGRQSFRITSSSPSNGGVTYGDQSIILYFNQTLKPTSEQNISLTSTPDIGGVLYIQGDSLVIDHNPLFDEDREYSLQLANIVSANNNKIDHINLKFRVKLSEQQKFIASLPYYGDGYSIEYILGDRRFFVQISKNPIEDYKARAAEYIKSKGFDLSVVNVVYEPIRSLEGRGSPALDTSTWHND